MSMNEFIDDYPIDFEELFRTTPGASIDLLGRLFNETNYPTDYVTIEQIKVPISRQTWFFVLTIVGMSIFNESFLCSQFSFQFTPP